MEAPVIGVCSAYERAQWSIWDMDAAIVPSTYLGHLAHNEAVPLVLVPSQHTITHASELVQRFDGLLLLGGADVDPSTYREKREPELEHTVLLRDLTEIALIRAAMKQGVPILGVCRGMQIMTVATGGKLTQDIATLAARHRSVLGSLDEQTQHPISVEPDSWVGKIYGNSTLVNSHHHQIVKTVGKNSRVTAICPEDGVIEAIEWDLPALTVGVQWHPEAAELDGVIAKFIQVCISHRNFHKPNYVSRSTIVDHVSN